MDTSKIAHAEYIKEPMTARLKQIASPIIQFSQAIKSCPMFAYGTFVEKSLRTFIQTAYVIVFNKL